MIRVMISKSGTAYQDLWWIIPVVIVFMILVTVLCKSNNKRQG